MSESTQSATSAPTESLEYRTEVKQLLDILAHSLYTDREIFLRELVSNASDALNRIQFEMLTNQDVLDPNVELAITITCDPASHTLTISDTGIGMNRDELVRNLGTIAHSGAKTFLQNAGEKQSTLEEIIGQFGVGFYSVFMVAEGVTVTSRSYRVEDEAWQWRSTGDSTFTLAPAEKTSRGTKIVIALKEDAHEFAQTWRIESIIRKHSDYVSFPIYVESVRTPEEESPDVSEQEDDETEAHEPVNRRTALWRQSPSKVQPEEYTDFYKQLTFDANDPLLHLHLVTDVPVNLRTLLFVPAQRERTNLRLRTDHGLRLYSRKVLIQEHNKELLPEYLRFVEGVVDSEDLPLNVSRETVQSNPIMRQIRRALTGRIHKELKSLADSEEPEAQERYTTFWKEFGIFVKEGVAIDPSSHETLVDLLRFHSSGVENEGLTSLKQYKERMVEGQKAIYYVLGEDLASVARSPHLDYFRKNKIEVLYLVDPIDGFVTSALPRFDDLPLQNVDSADLDLPASAEEKAETEENPALAGEQFDEVVKRFIAVLGDRIKSVREAKLLVDSPCRLVSTDDAFDRDLQRFRRLTEENYETPKKVLEINRRHPTIAGLADLIQSNPADSLIDNVIEQLFDNALLLEGLKANPVDMVARMQAILAAAVERRA